MYITAIEKALDGSFPTLQDELCYQKFETSLSVLRIDNHFISMNVFIKHQLNSFCQNTAPEDIYSLGNNV